jgi:predicted O-methyltransferase YrrM
VQTWNIRQSIDYLLAIRDQLGPVYGSEDLCMLLYNMVRREQPQVVVELGTGLGVTTAWIASALKEVGAGCIYSFDNGSHFQDASVKAFLSQLTDKLHELARLSETGSYEDCMRWIFDRVDVADRIKLIKSDIDFNAQTMESVTQGRKIDLLFSDFNHAPKTIIQLLGAYLPHMNTTSAIYIDSASTHLPSHWMLENLVQMLNAKRIPATLRHGLDRAQSAALQDLVVQCHFQLVHLVEKAPRSQNSTAWIRIGPDDLFPAHATHVRFQ